MLLLKRLLSALFFAFLVLLGMWVAQDNAAPASLTLLGFPVATLPLGLLLLAVFFVGAILGVLSSSLIIFRLRGRLRRYQRYVQSREANRAS